MSEWEHPVFRADRSSVLLWWQSFFRRYAVHTPWVLCCLAYLAFVNSGQGLTALEYPVAYPKVGVMVAGALIGMYGAILKHLLDSYENPNLRNYSDPNLQKFKPLPLDRLPLVLAPPIVTLDQLREGNGVSLDRRRLLRNLFRIALVVCVVLTWAFASDWLGPLLLVIFFAFAVRRGSRGFLISLTAAIAAGTATVAGLSNNPWTMLFLLLSGLAGIVVANVSLSIGALISAGTRRVFGNDFADRFGPWFINLGPLGLALLLYAVGIYMVSHHIEMLVGMGSHALVASGLLLLALLLLGITYLLWHQATLRVGWIVLGLFLLIHMLQDPIPERPNPLLVTPPEVDRAQTTCATLSRGSAEASAKETSATEAKRAPSPSILISAEGGGARAAYWSALSLEELSQSGPTPLLDDTEIISGVSGGSLGIATFLAAQELPRNARLPCIREFLGSDFLSPLVAGLLFLDVPRLVLPAWILDKHRGDCFEDYIARRWRMLTGSDYFYRPIERAAGDRHWRTVVYFNATDALSGQYIALTARPPGSVLPELSSLNVAVLARLSGLRIAQAVHMSARFPYISPNPDLRVPASEASLALFKQASSAHDLTGNVSLASLVDGGYFDNSGLWPILRLLEAERDKPIKPRRFVLHIVNDQVRACEDTPEDTGCIQAAAGSLKERRSTIAGWLARPTQAIQAVGSEHALQSVTALKLARPHNEDRHLWSAPIGVPEALSPSVLFFLDLIQHLPIHGDDVRERRVALAWTLAPWGRKFLCAEAAKIGTINIPYREKTQSVDRSEDCAP